MDARTPTTRIPGYSRARLERIIAVGNIVAMAIGLWTILLPTHFYALVVSLCFLLPICALALDLRTRGVLGFESRRGRSPLSLALIVLLPALALAGRAGIDLNFEAYTLLIATAVLAAAAIFALFWYFDPQLRGDRNQITTIAMFALAYCYGALAFADVVFDPSSGRETQTVVLEKRIHVSGNVKGSSVWYQLKVDPEASPAGANWINVQPDLWGSFHRGDSVCVQRGPGLLAVRWFAVALCAD